MNAQNKGKWAERTAAKWLRDHKFTICYSHKGKASNLPYDILCYKGRDVYALDVKTGKKPAISLISLAKLITKKHSDYVKETEGRRIRELKKTTKIGYAFVIEDTGEVILFSVDKNQHRAYKAWDTILKR
ncbi:hypothetical protein ACFL6S_23310 [Candidatus Poribacteria bacterium]